MEAVEMPGLLCLEGITRGQGREQSREDATVVYGLCLMDPRNPCHGRKGCSSPDRK